VIGRAPDQALFGFVQLEFGFLLGPPDGRYLVRRHADDEPEAVLVLGTLGAPERRRLRGRRGRVVDGAQAEPVPTARATVIRPRPFGSEDEANRWLSELRTDGERAAAELEGAAAVLARAVHAHRVAAADPGVPEAHPDHALVIRVGFGGGEAVADGRFESAWELPRETRRTKRSMEAPEERFAAILGGRERALASEALVLRVRADLDAGRPREAALEARVALEALLAELPGAGLAEDRAAVGEAANAALRGELSESVAAALERALEHMEMALKRRRLGG
jgi:hypothetical protein